MKKLEQILRDREKLLERFSDSPFSSFYGKITISEELITQIFSKLDENELSYNSTIQEALKNFTVSLVTGMEVYFKDWCRLFVDQHGIDYKKFPFGKKSNEPKFSLEDIDYIVTNQLTMGEIIVKYGNFQNFKKIVNIISKMLDIKLINDLKNMKLKVGKKIAEFDKDDIASIEKIIEDRHDFVHDIELFRRRTNLTFDERMKSYSILTKFCIMVEYIIRVKLNMDTKSLGVGIPFLE